MEIKEGELIMGVGSGSTNLFVKGDYDSITVLQQKLFELEELRRDCSAEEKEKEIDKLKDELIQLKLEMAADKAKIKMLEMEIMDLRTRSGTYNPFQPECPKPFIPNKPMLDEPYWKFQPTSTSLKRPPGVTTYSKD